MQPPEILLVKIQQQLRISDLCKLTVATIQGWLLFEGGVYYNAIMIAMATIQNQVVLWYK